MRWQRFWGLVVAACLLLGSASVWAYNYLAEEAITVAGTPIGFTSATISQGSGHEQAVQATCTLETAQVRFTIDGTTTVTSVTGYLWDIGVERTFNGPDVLRNFRATRTGSTSGVLTCLYNGQ